ncbi:hypothetical protein J132_10204 [Termitomyces sp. J132]|nr:hypothetical protein H2248_008362 [Termitomyces sp. 'cryptogamus']KNZ81925.1 hypothetical protein J132_10204 [Termitomyces sp. J132]
MPPVDASILEELSMLRKSQAELQSLMQDLMSRLHASPAASLPPAAAPSEASTFVPPIPSTGINGVSSAASLSLHTHFPDVNTAVIVAIITHEFKASDLHKLDPTNWDKETAYTFNGSTNQFKVSNRVAREYKTPFSMIISLQSYFDILSFHISNVSATSTFFRYMAHLMKLVAEYEWSAVYDYHAVFFNHRRAEMVVGDFSQWGKRDNDLLSEHVYLHRKPMPSKHPKAHKLTSNPGKACRKFNDGRCTTSPCPWGHPHSCATCGKLDHGKHQHKD